jgi:glucose uptake protein GlcU
MLKSNKLFLRAMGVFLLITPSFALAQYARPTGTGLPEGILGTIIINVMNWLLIIVGIIGVISFVIAGIIYLTSAGDDNKAKTAKAAMTYAIVGIVVALMGYVIIQAVDTMLNEGADF